MDLDLDGVTVMDKNWAIVVDLSMEVTLAYEV